MVNLLITLPPLKNIEININVYLKLILDIYVVLTWNLFIFTFNYFTNVMIIVYSK